MDMTPPPLDIAGAFRFPGVFYGVIAVALTWFAARALTSTSSRLGIRFSDRRLLLNQIATVVRFFVWLLGLTFAGLLALNLSKELVLALAGTAAVTIGFALKDLASSIIAGITIIVDRPFQVGDRVTFEGTYGEVTSIGLRSVHLTTLDDNVVTIPNNKFLTEVVSSGNWGALDMLIQLDFYVGMDADVALARRLVEQALTACRFAYTRKPWTVVVNQVVEGQCFAVRLRAKVYVLDVRYETDLQTDVSERVIEGFRAHGIGAPAILHRDTAALRASATPAYG